MANPRIDDTQARARLQRVLGWKGTPWTMMAALPGLMVAVSIQEGLDPPGWILVALTTGFLLGALTVDHAASTELSQLVVRIFESIFVSGAAIASGFWSTLVFEPIPANVIVTCAAASGVAGYLALQPSPTQDAEPQRHLHTKPDSPVETNSESAKQEPSSTEIIEVIQALAGLAAHHQSLTAREIRDASDVSIIALEKILRDRPYRSIRKKDRLMPETIVNLQPFVDAEYPLDESA